VPTLVWQRGGTFLDQRDVKHDPLDNMFPRTGRCLLEAFSPTKYARPASRSTGAASEIFRRQFANGGALHRAACCSWLEPMRSRRVHHARLQPPRRTSEFRRSGFTTMESLQTATSAPAKF